MATSWTELKAEIEAEQKLRHDEVVTVNSLKATSQGKRLVLEVADCELAGEYDVTERFLKRAGSKDFFAGLGSRALCELALNEDADEQDVELAASVLNNSMRHVDADKEFLLRLREPGRGLNRPTVRTLQSSRYSPVNHLAVVEAVEQSVPRGTRLSDWELGNDGDTLSGRALVVDEVLRGPRGDSDYNPMLGFGNSVIGTQSYWTSAMVYRLVCTNGMTICIEQKTKNRHTGQQSWDDVLGRIQPAIAEGLAEVGDATKSLIELRKLKVDKKVGIDRLALGLNMVADHYIQGITLPQAKQVFTAFNEEPHFSAAGIVNAITRAAQQHSLIERGAMERIAGVICTRWRQATKHFDRFVTDCAEIGDRKVELFLAA